MQVPELPQADTPLTDADLVMVHQDGQLKKVSKTQLVNSIGIEAESVSYDNTDSGLNASNAQAAIDVLADAIASGVTDGDKGDVTVSGSGTVWTVDNIDANKLPSNIDAVKIGGGAVSNTEFGYLDGVSSAIQTQINTINSNNTGTNTGDQNIFKTISVSGQSDVVADTTADTLTLVAGTNVTITTNAGTDTVTINATSGGTPGGSDQQIQYNDSGSFGAESDFTYDKSTNTLNVGNSTSSSNGVIIVGGSGTGTGKVTGGGGSMEVNGSPLTFDTTDATDGNILFKTNTVQNGSINASTGDWVISTTLTLPNTGLHILDTNASHDLIIAPGSNITADRTLTLTTGDADRTLTLSGNATISGTNTGDQTTVTGNAGTATALQTARTIGGVSFDGTANIVPQTIESANEATDTTCFPLFVTASGTQQLQPKNNTSLTFNSNTGALGATTLGGTLSTSAQTNITSVGTLTGGSTGAGFTVALGTSTVTGVLTETHGGAGSINGILKANGSGTVSLASGGTDYTNTAFKTISVSGQSDVVADSASDTLTLVAGTNVTITTNAGTDTITIAASGGGGGGGDVSGPISSTDTALALWDGTGGDTLKDSSITVSSGTMTFPTGSHLQPPTSGGSLNLTAKDNAHSKDVDYVTLSSGATPSNPSAFTLQTWDSANTAYKTVLSLSDGSSNLSNTQINSCTLSGTTSVSSGGLVMGNNTIVSSGTTSGDKFQISGFNTSGPSLTSFITVTSDTSTSTCDLASSVTKGGNTIATTSQKLSAFASTSSSELAGVISDETGSGALVFASTPTLVTPVLGAATGTSLQLSGLTASSALATDGSKNLVSVTNTGSGNNVLATSPTLVTPVLGVASATTVNKVTLTTPASGSTLTIADGKTFTASNTITLTGTDSVSFNVSNNKLHTCGFSALAPTVAQQGTYYVCPFAGTISAWNIVVDAGTATVKVWKIATGTTAPTTSNSINTSGIAISTGTAIRSTTLTDFTTTTVTANDIFGFEITSVSGVNKIDFQLELTAT